MTDRLDDELQRLGSDLRAAAATMADSTAVLAALHDGSLSSPVRPTRRRHDRLAIVGAALLIAASLVAVAIVGGTSHHAAVGPATDGTQVTTSSPIVIAPSTTIAATTTLPTADAYDLGTMSFIDSTTGWLVATNQAEDTFTLFRTTDAGAHWEGVPTAGVPVDARPFGVAFADARNGWLWGDGWWSTHDGGSTWKALPPSDASGNTPNQMFSSGGFAYALLATSDSKGFIYSLVRSPIGSDEFADTGLAWRKGAGGNAVALSLVSQGSRLFVSYNDRGGQVARLVGGAADTTWKPLGAGRGGNIDLTAAPDGTNLYLTTQTGIWGGDATSALVVARSDDGGDTFAPMPLPPDVGGSDAPLRFCGLRAPDGASVAVLGCAADGSTLIYGSVDQGGSWNHLGTVPPSAYDIQFVTPQLVTCRTVDQPAALMVSSDGGVTWRQSFPPAG